MKLLLDENLSRRLIGQVADLFPGTVHVSSVNLLQASDVEVWEHAKLFGLCIVTADASPGSPQSVPIVPRVGSRKSTGLTPQTGHTILVISIGALSCKRWPPRSSKLNASL